MIVRTYRMVRNSLVGGIGLCLILCGCGGNSQQKSTELRQMLESWQKSLNLVHQQWTEHRVPDTYIQQLLDAARKKLAQTRKQIRQLAKDQPAQAGPLESLARDVESQINAVNTAVGKK